MWSFHNRGSLIAWLIIFAICLPGCSRIQPGDVTELLQVYLGDQPFDGTPVEMTTSQVKPMKVTLALRLKEVSEQGHVLLPIDQWWVQGYVEKRGADPNSVYTAHSAGPMYFYGPLRKYKGSGKPHSWYMTLGDANDPYAPNDMGEPVVQPPPNGFLLSGYIPLPTAPGEYTLVVFGVPYAVPKDREINVRRDTVRLLEAPVTIKPTA